MKTKEELYSETFEVMNVNDREVLFTCLRINRDIIPEGLHAYDIRESDNGGEFATIEPRVIVNHAGTILSKEVSKWDLMASWRLTSTDSRTR